jgi:hypothetical protein
MEELVSQFDEKDFLHSRNKSVAGKDDVVTALKIYQDELEGNISRKKNSQRKVLRIESSMTLRGVKKLSDARKTLRMRMQEGERKLQRELLTSGGNSEINFDKCPLAFMQQMQLWGQYPTDDRRYYLHMVFRFYLKDYHDHVARLGSVIQNPSYQYILDALHPCGSASKFPPEFRQFLRDAAGRKIEIRSLPVPVKGSANQVSYDHNFEAIVEVSELRRKIESFTLEWKTDKYKNPVYPRYLWVGSPNTQQILDGESFARKVNLIRQGVRRLGDVDLSKLKEFCNKVVAANTMYEDYNSHVFKATGEQLRERLGFYTVPKYREVFYALSDHSLVEDLFKSSGANMDVFFGFKTFCTKKALGIDVILGKDENLCRSVLMVMVDVAMFFYVVQNLALAEMDPLGALKGAVTRIEARTSRVGLV